MTDDLANVSEQAAPLAGLRFTPMTRAYAEDIVQWEYPDYPLFTTSLLHLEFEIQVLLEPTYHYFVGINQSDAVVGFCCFGADARVPGGDYAPGSVVDVGLGLHPSLLGKGWGRPFLEAALDVGAVQFTPDRFRATIAVSNMRSRRVFERVGFQVKSTFQSTNMRPLTFIILEKSVRAE